MSELVRDSEDNIKCKVVLIGRSGVGKTSIISRYTTDNFKESLMTTAGPSFNVKIMEFPEEKEKIKFEIWDTAGQERYRSMAKTFYINASSCVLVYDITVKKSFDEIKEYWAPQVKENAPKDTSMWLLILIIIIYITLVLVLAGNKSDKYMNAEVTDEEGKELAKEINAIYLRTSAKLNSSIDEIFNNIGKKILNPNFEVTAHLTKEEMIRKSEQLRRGQTKNDNRRTGCCG